MAGVALDEDGQDFGGMGTDLGDLNGDGLPEILTTTISLERYAYYVNLGNALFDYENRFEALWEPLRTPTPDGE